ncbi:MAG: tRNA (adenosine(37)-N6)-threonylcarbamoyltransferase complex dimerization subunit type 1 TsaB [Rickettsiales bacterium]|nr:tRNA (adenosine(37)-N6)-threonylcarbamoyltransferase complex dimerization subunit type 1 TsaB [Rickettsiales bacterium]
MRILAFDTSASGFSVAIAENEKLLSKKIITESGKQSEFLILEIEKLLRENKIWYQDLDLIATTNGPGSFTGTRIGLTAGRTIKLATNLPLILINSCEAVAYKYREKSENIFVLLDARGDDFFYSYNSSEPQLARLEDLPNIFPKENFFLCGSGKTIAAEILKKENFKFEMNESDNEIEADLLALLAYEKFQKEMQGSENLDPIYLRAPRISERKK